MAQTDQPLTVISSARLGLEQLAPLVESLLTYSDIRRNDPRENREALRCLIAGELADKLRSMQAEERSQWRELVGQLIACHEDSTCPAVDLARDMLAGLDLGIP